jgi:pyridoxamine 5'-phosphate oxidase
LLKGADRDGFVFYTNLESAKGRNWRPIRRRRCCSDWKSLRRQVRVRGPVSR